jgi:hypothetical protein
VWSMIFCSAQWTRNTRPLTLWQLTDFSLFQT